jgi:hypothetical protein
MSDSSSPPIFKLGGDFLKNTYKLDPSKPIADLSYYKPVNDNQKDFHKSNSKNRLLIGGYRSGKTYPAIHEDLFICGDHPGHEFAVFRNTEGSLRSNIMKDFLNVADAANCIKNWNDSNMDLTLWNDCIVRFRPLSLSRAQFKGMNLCGWHIDDPDVNRYKETISFLYSRLTDPPGVKAKYFNTIITANYEGHDWLWKTYMRRREQGGDDLFAYWICKTNENPTLDEDYIPMQAATHNDAWMKRYIYGEIDGFVGLVFDEYDPKAHDSDLSWCVDDHSLRKILVIDLGITHPTVVYKMATDFENVFCYDEWYKVNIRTHDLGYYLVDVLNSGEKFYKILIDPKACAREQTSGISPRKILQKDFGIHCDLANNDVKNGIHITKDIMTVRNDEPHFFIDPNRCPKGVEELENLKWKEPQYSDFDELAYKEEPEDKDNDATDCIRYGSVFFRKKLRSMSVRDSVVNLNRLKNWDNRIANLKAYRNCPDGGRIVKSNIIREYYYKKRQQYLNSLSKSDIKAM